jgi:DNA invertase Pin-like site-specific DNA recombinase
MRKAILYIRVSTDEQADKGYSQNHQEERLRKFCEINGYGWFLFIVRTIQQKLLTVPGLMNCWHS